MGLDPGIQADGVRESLDDITIDDLLRLKPGERLWKLYCFRSGRDDNDLRHRIYTKLKTDGRLEMVTFAVHNPADAEPSVDRSTRAVRSNIARVPDLPVEYLERIIHAMLNANRQPDETCDEIDLSAFTSLEDQIAWLRARV